MPILWMQILVLSILAIALVLWLVCFPGPSPLLRRWLPARKRWPEAQVRRGVEQGRLPAAFVRYFNRDPERTPPPGRSVLAPADGLLTSAEVRAGIRYLVIALSFWDMHVQRSPLAGTVVHIVSLGSEYMDGEGRDFAFLREKTCPVQKRLVLDTACGEIAVRLITSLVARRIETWVDTGDVLERGQRIGRILMGSTVVLELPAEMPLKVQPGEQVRAGETVLAEGVRVP